MHRRDSYPFSFNKQYVRYQNLYSNIFSLHILKHPIQNTHRQIAILTAKKYEMTHWRGANLNTF